MARRNRMKSPVSPELDYLVGIAAAAMSAPQPRIPINKTKYKTFFNFLKRCTPENIYGLAHAHATTLENIQAFARHLDTLGCRCGQGKRPAEDHVDICPVRLRTHRFFEAFTAVGADWSYTRMTAERARSERLGGYLWADWTSGGWDRHDRAPPGWEDGQ